MDISHALFAARLTPRYRHIVASRYGLDCPPKTLAEIAKDLGISYARVQQIHDKSIRRIRECVERIPDERP